MGGRGAFGAIGVLSKTRGHQFSRRPFVLPMIAVVIPGMLALVFGIGSIAIAPKSFATTTDDWPSYSFSASRSGFNGAETAITTTTAGSLVSQWTTSTGGAVISGEPVTSNGLVYWGAWDGIFRATRP